LEEQPIRRSVGSRVPGDMVATQTVGLERDVTTGIQDD